MHELVSCSEIEDLERDTTTDIKDVVRRNFGDSVTRDFKFNFMMKAFKWSLNACVKFSKELAARQLHRGHTVIW